MTRPRRWKLEDFPCSDDVSHCHEGCDGWPDNACAVGIVYKEYLDLQRCARLLRTLEVNLGGSFMAAIIGQIDRLSNHGRVRNAPALGEWMRTQWQYQKLRGYIRKALREVGL